MSRNDGRPKSVGALKLDPLPYVKDLDGTLTRASNNCGGFPVEFLPRPGFIQDEEMYV